MRNQLVAQGVWDVVSGQGDEPPSSREWERKNAAALHAIRLSCREEFVAMMDNASTAKYAWEVLFKMFRGHDGLTESDFEGSNGEEDDPTVPDRSTSNNRITERGRSLLLVDSIRRDKEKSIEYNLRQMVDQESGLIISKNGYTTLHAAVSAGQLEGVSRVLAFMSIEDMEIRDRKKRTALALAAYLGRLEIAKKLVAKNPPCLESKTTGETFRY